MISNQPQAAPPNRPSETRTPLNAVFRRLSGPLTPPAPGVAPPRPEQRAPVAAAPAEVAEQTPAMPPASAAVSALAGAPAPIAPTGAGAAPAPTPLRASLAAAVLARASAAIAAHPPSEPGPQAAAMPLRAAEAPVPPAPAEAAPPQPAETPAEAAPSRPAETPAETQPAPPLTKNPAYSEPLAVPASEAARTPQSEPTPPVPVPAWSVPTWLVAPVLAFAIPDSPFGWGNRAVEAPGPGPASAPGGADPGGAEPREAEPATVGFAEPESTASVAPEPKAAAPAAPPIETSPAASAEVVAETTPGPALEPAAAAENAGEGSGPSETLAEALRRGVAAEAPPAHDGGDPPAAPLPLPRSAGETRPWAQHLRAERPLGAPQAAPKTEVAAMSAAQIAPATAAGPGLPASDLPPVLVEPRVNPVAEIDTALAPRPGDRPEDRATLRNRRLYRRVGIEAEFEIDGAAAQLVDLSIGGFAAANAPRLAPGAIAAVTVRLSIDGVDISTRMRARMIYFDDLHANTRRSGGRFVDLTASQTAFLRYVVTWRGQSVGALGTTTLLDAITRWPERGLPASPPEPEPREPRTPWWSRMFGWLRARGYPDQ